MKVLMCLLLSLCLSVAGVKAADNMEKCQALIEAAEQEPSEQYYLSCGFSNPKVALGYWGPMAQQKKWKNALYEVYRRNKRQLSAKVFLYKAAELGHPEALIVLGDEKYAAGKVPEAMRYYNVAIRSNVDDITQGKITGRVALLYANPASPYYDVPKALPMLEKAALQRDALSNNVLGVWTLFGENGAKRSPEEAFKYIWRAILLGCPAAEENLGFFLLGRSQKIDNDTLLSEMHRRVFSCDAVPETSVNMSPYHLSVNAEECSSINYYAERLVDTSLDFTGKDKCGFSADMNDLANFLSKE